MTDLNIAKLGVVFPDIKFSKDLSIDCYLELDDGVIATFLTKENTEEDELSYLKTILLEENENPLMFFIFSINKNKYYLFNDLYFKNIKKNIFLLETTEGLNYIDFLDIALLASELDITIDCNNKPFFNDDNEFHENNSIKTYLPFLELILTAKRPYNSLTFLSSIGLLNIFFPFLNDLIGVEQDRSLHPEGDVYNHTLHCFQFVKKPTLKLAFGLLLHDYGKALPSLKDFSEHSTLGANKVKEILKPYGYEDDFINDVIFLVQYHMINSYFYRINDQEKIRIFNNKLGSELLKLFKADTLGFSRKA